ncbi:unnamed protein product [Schistocephalus solidus]|uniref:NTF2 domain-containing protein n=1 Tax=Schistocephalus solidus TaxID=70667 RepID=A0A183SW21_SCHSO|nr:unnamed protein product [Schistocephalus solidus]
MSKDKFGCSPLDLMLMSLAAQGLQGWIADSNCGLTNVLKTLAKQSEVKAAKAHLTSCSLNDVPKFEIIGTHGTIAVQFVGKIVDVDNEQYWAENRALGNTTLNLNFSRLFVADMHSL